MAHADERLFSPTLLGKAEYVALTGCVQLSACSTTLELCRALRRLAEQREAVFADDGVVGHLRLAAAASVLADLCEQEWRVAFREGNIWISPPDWTHDSGHDVARIKSRVRNSLQISSDRQIATEAVQEFIRLIERNRVFDGGIVSIATLIDDGRDLFDKLRALAPLDRADRAQQLRKLVNPYLQACEDGATCEFTGMSLFDIWRYFRHTWSLEYNSVPGRTLRILVRNRARPNHPVIGIAMLASPAANMYVRDGWIGWRLDDVVTGLASGKLDAGVVANVLWSTVKAAISEIRSDDLLSEVELRRPTEETFFKLRQIAGLAQRRRHEHLAEPSDDAGADDAKIVDIRTFRKRNPDWHRLSATPLFVKKRSEQLIQLLRAYAFLKAADFDRLPEAALYESIVTKEGRSVITFALNELRKRKLATEAADLSVCGAIEPYNHLLGGKLVALLMGSQDIRRLYAERYARQESEIASQMAGRSIVRSTNLCVATTTSLYGISSSQYNRLKISDPDLEWRHLGQTEGITVTHLSRRTVGIMRKLGTAEYGARRINSVFGEGSSPRTRQIREGLNLIGINNSLALEQSIGRRVYACELIPEGRRVLTGFSGRKRQRRGASASTVARAWIDRWLVNRVLSIDVLERVRASYPAAISKTFKERALRGALDADDEPTLDLWSQASE